MVGDKEVDNNMAGSRLSVVHMEHMVVAHMAVLDKIVDLNFVEYNTDTYFPIFAKKKKNFVIFYLPGLTGSK